MAVVFLQKKREQKKLILIFCVVLSVTFFVIWYGFFRKTGGTTKTFVYTVPIPKTININFEILDNEYFKNMDPFYEIQPLATTSADISGVKPGRENPFITF